MTTGPTTKPIKKKVTLATAWTEARELILAHRRRLIPGLFLMLISRSAGLVLPGTTSVLLDDVIGKHRVDLLPWIAAAIGVASVVQAATGFALAQILGVAAQRAINDLRKTVQAHITRLPVRFFDSTTSGALIARVMTDAEGIRNLVGNGLVELVGGLITASVALVVLFVLNWELTLAILGALLVFGAGMAIAFKKLRPLFRERGKINSEVTGRLNESFSGIRIVKAYTAEAREQQVFRGGVDRLFANVRRSITGVSAVGALSILVMGGVGALMLVVGGHSMLDGSMTVGNFVRYTMFTAFVAAPVVQIASIGTQITEAFAGLDRIREIRRLATEDSDDATRAACGRVTGHVVLEDVTFSYEPGHPVLKHVSLATAAGATTALVGSSGSGKSTLVSLVMAFQRPDSGRVLVDGHDLATLRLGDFRAQLGVVMQDNFLFDGTVAENIAFARPEATRDDIVRVARLAHCEEFVTGFEKGFDTVVGERGVKLSGGQRQRIAIARALLADPRILILDEATSSLDSESEAAIQDGLQALRRGRTTFVIAHRLSTIRGADQIAVLEAGEIVERGTHQELMALNGRYRQLHDRQYRFETDRFVNPGEELVAAAPPPKVPAAAAGADDAKE